MKTTRVIVRRTMRKRKIKKKKSTDSRVKRSRKNE